MEDNKLELALDGLTDRQKSFILNYLGGGSGIMLNATAAARESGYSYPNQIAFAILQSDKIQAIIQEFFSNITMSKEETLARLSELARADISQFLKRNQHGDMEIDFDAVLSKGYLIKSCYQDSRGNWRLELHDSMRALELVGKSQNLFSDKFDVNVTDTRDQHDSEYMRALKKVYSNTFERYDRVENADGEVELVEKPTLTDEDRARLDAELEQAGDVINSETQRLLGDDKPKSANYYIRGERR